ncbi:GH92 family glycosyl hydrolase [uncultured Mucilaginibacter sp.]|uniref:GH92 family glycosyl hydrolase n=1 Tax=uncultured Mucilaginibacter sp. TaxID=797541 RepID=UPI00260007D6|nr:GH92 family glycosyl hydrolase [uncultured Mucilaginibacter sp.]
MRNLFCLLFCICVGKLAFPQQSQVVNYVDPFIGTGGTGHTYPGATVPNGMVQLSPETGYAGWNYCAGYRHEDSTILGFSHTHLSGTGALDLGDILLMPFTGKVTPQEYYKSSFSHQDEKASAGYYSVKLKTFDVKAELTASAHVGMHRYSYPAKQVANLLLDLRHGLVGESPGNLDRHVMESNFKMENRTTLSGYTITNGWAGRKHVYFVMQLNQPFSSYTWVSDSTAKRNQRVVFQFNKPDRSQVVVKVGISSVSIENARQNLKEEAGNFDFDQLQQRARQQWERELACVDIDASKPQKQIFYTALYHALVAPNNIADVNGQYRGADNKVYTSPGKAYYSTLSLWDTFRALNPLYTILYPQKTNGIVASMIDHYKVVGYLPIWTLWGHENFCMIGNHAVPVIADAYLKGIRNYDTAKAYEAIRTSLTANHRNSQWDLYNKYGYLPSNLYKVESVSTTLENGVDDWSAAQVAKAMGKTADYQMFTKRAGFYKNLFDRSTNLMRGKNSDGTWVKPFDAFKISHASTSGGDYTEGNAWHYSWHVMQDVDGLMNLYGGKKRFVSKLDSLFALDSKVYGDGATVDVSGLIGQYVQGNEPSHHVAYLYTLAGAPHKTQEKINTIVNTLYSNQPDGLSGNDDCGQMSAWYIFSTLGFYPVNPASGKYVFGVPAFKKATLKLGGKSFIVEARNLSDRNRYIGRIQLNGKPYTLPYITHAAIMKGGQLTFEMTDRPSIASLNN